MGGKAVVCKCGTHESTADLSSGNMLTMVEVIELNRLIVEERAAGKREPTPRMGEFNATITLTQESNEVMTSQQVWALVDAALDCASDRAQDDFLHIKVSGGYAMAVPPVYVRYVQLEYRLAEKNRQLEGA